MKILQTSCVAPAVDGGVSNVEYFLIKGLKERGHDVKENFPKIKSMVITDFLCGLAINTNFKDIVHCHTNIGWDTRGAVRTFHGCTAQGEEIANSEGNKVLKKGIYFKINTIMEWLSAHNNHCIAVSDYTADAISKYYNVKRENIITVHNGIDTNKFYPNKNRKSEMRKGLGIPKNAFVVNFVGGFEFNKGIFYLKEIVDFCKDNKKIWFLIRSSVKSEIPEQYKWVLNYPQVKFLSHGLDMNEFYNSGDVFITPATYDPMPLTVLESMSCAKPIICSSSGGFVEVIEHKKSGYIINDYHNTKQMAKYILYLEKNRTRCKKMGMAARKRILEKFTIDHMVNNYIKAYKHFKDGGD